MLELMSKTNYYKTHKRETIGKPEIIFRPIIFEEKTESDNEQLDVRLSYANINNATNENPDLMKKMMAFS